MSPRLYRLPMQMQTTKLSTLLALRLALTWLQSSWGFKNSTRNISTQCSTMMEHHTSWLYLDPLIIRQDTCGKSLVMLEDFVHILILLKDICSTLDPEQLNDGRGHIRHCGTGRHLLLHGKHLGHLQLNLVQHGHVTSRVSFPCHLRHGYQNGAESSVGRQRR